MFILQTHCGISWGVAPPLPKGKKYRYSPHTQKDVAEITGHVQYAKSTHFLSKPLFSSSSAVTVENINCSAQSMCRWPFYSDFPNLVLLSGLIPERSAVTYRRGISSLHQLVFGHEEAERTRSQLKRDVQDQRSVFDR